MIAAHADDAHDSQCPVVDSTTALKSCTWVTAKVKIAMPRFHAKEARRYMDCTVTGPIMPREKLDTDPCSRTFGRMVEVSARDQLGHYWVMSLINMPIPNPILIHESELELARG